MYNNEGALLLSNKQILTNLKYNIHCLLIFAKHNTYTQPALITWHAASLIFSFSVVLHCISKFATTCELKCVP